MGVQILSALRSSLRFETAGLNTEPVIPRYGYAGARLPYTVVATDGSRRHLPVAPLPSHERRLRNRNGPNQSYSLPPARPEVRDSARKSPVAGIASVLGSPANPDCLNYRALRSG